MAIGIVRTIALHAIADGIAPLLLGGTRRNRAADDGRADPDADCRADTVTSASAPTAAPASTPAALCEGRRDARCNKGAGRGNHAECVHE